MRWAVHVARMGKMINAYSILNGKPEGKNHSEDLGVDGEIILEWIVGNRGAGGRGLDASALWRALVNTVVNLRVPLKAENFLTS